MGGRAAAWPGAVVYAEGRAGLRLAEPGVQGLCAPVVLHPLKRLVLKFLDFRPEIPMSVRVSDARRPSRLCPVELRVGSGFPLLLSVLARRVGRRPLQGAALGSCQLSGGRRIVERSPSASVLTKPVHSAVSRGRGPVVTSASSSPSSSAALALGCFSLCLESSHLCAL